MSGVRTTNRCSFSFFSACISVRSAFARAHLLAYFGRLSFNCQRSGSDFETFFAQAPAFHPNSSLIKGVVCGVRVEDIDDPLMQKIRYLDKLIDELAKGKPMEKILRG